MSLVIAIKENNRIYLGCDSQVTSGGTRTTLQNQNNYKVWKVNGTDHCIMASVGNFRDACVVRTMFDLVTDYDVYKKRVNFDFVVNSVVPEIIERLKEAHYIADSGVFMGMDSSWLFAYEDKLFEIASDGSVLEIEDFVAIGSGKKEAIGSLLSTNGQEPEKRIITAIKAGAASDIYVDYPIIITDTKKTAFKVITEETEKKFTK